MGRSATQAFRGWRPVARRLCDELHSRVPTDGRIRSFTISAADDEAVALTGTVWIECTVGWVRRAHVLLGVELARVPVPFRGGVQVAVEGVTSFALPLFVGPDGRVEANKYLVRVLQRQLREEKKHSLDLFLSSAVVIRASAEAVAAASGMRPVAADTGWSQDLQRFMQVFSAFGEARGGEVPPAAGTSVHSSTSEGADDDDLFDAWAGVLDEEQGV